MCQLKYRFRDFPFWKSKTRDQSDFEFHRGQPEQCKTFVGGFVRHSISFSVVVVTPADVVVMERSVVGRLAGVLGVSSVETVFQDRRDRASIGARRTVVGYWPVSQFQIWICR